MEEYFKQVEATDTEKKRAFKSWYKGIRQATVDLMKTDYKENIDEAIEKAEVVTLSALRVLKPYTAEDDEDDEEESD